MVDTAKHTKLCIGEKNELEVKDFSARELDTIRMCFGFGCEKISIEEIQTSITTLLSVL